jgi:Concanavalin A-like lectin/glucanases superfamily/Viral BACON domain
VADTQISPYYVRSSYGLTTLSNTVTTQLYRMPQTASYYAVNGANDQLLADAETAAAANYTLGNYDRIVLLFSWLGSISGSQINYGGMANVGGPEVWVNGEFDFRVVAHELGHTYGLYHGNLWQVHDGNPISPNGSSTEYGDDFDTMGANYANDQRTDFNPWFKNMLGWIADSQVVTATTNGTYRIYRFDNQAATGTLALKVVKDSTHNYWIGCRRSFTNNISMQNGAYAIWGYNYNTHSDLLDMTTPGNSDQDAALAVGTNFTDSAALISIRPVAEGGVTPHEYLDVQFSEPALIARSPANLAAFVQQGNNPPSQSFAVWDSSSTPLSYTITTNASWLSVSPASGTSSGATNLHLVSYSAAGLTAGVYSASITIAATNTLNSPQSVAVSLYVNRTVSGLLGWWPLNEAGGSIAYDSSGNTNTGAFAGVQWLGGLLGPAPYFDGTAQVTVPNSVTLNPANAITICAWVNADNWYNTPRILEKGQTDNQYGLLINSSGSLEFWLAGVTNGTLSTSPPSEQVWHHVAGIYDGSWMTIYLDGQVVAQRSASGSLAMAADALTIGNRPGGNSVYKFSGLLSDVRVYGRALTAAEIAQIYNVDTIGDGIPNWWRQQYFGSGPTTGATSCATCDFDGTGQNNLFKYVAGLDPTDPTQVFSLGIAGVTNQPSQSKLVFTPLALGRYYTPQFSTNLVGGIWLPLATYSGPFTNGSQITITDTNALPPQEFYRIQISLP